MEIIDEEEELGGMTKAIESGMAKLRIEESATRKQARIDSGQETIVGVNKYMTENEEQVEVLSIDNTQVRQSQVDRLDRIRAERDEAAVEACLEKLRDSAAETSPTSGGEKNLLGLAVEAARCRATVGEISSALEDVWG